MELGMTPHRLAATCIRLAAAAGLLGVGCASPHEVADLVLSGGKVVTVDPRGTIVQALAARGERIVFLGSDEEAAAWIGPDTQVLDLDGALAIPGFIEGHGHFYSLGLSLLQLDLREAATWDEIVERVGRAAAGVAPGAWILGQGWHQSKWREAPEPSWDGLPGHDRLSAATLENPVYLSHASGHGAFVNARALALAGIDAHTPDPPGGEIQRDDRGEPTGFLRETAEDLVTRLLPSSTGVGSGAGGSAWDRNEVQRVVELAGEDCLRKGITSFQDAGSPLGLVDLYRRLALEQALPVRLWVMVRDDNASLAQRLAEVRQIDAGGGYLTVRAIKKAIDGALGTHGAWLLEPYADLPSSSGLITTPLEELRETAQLALAHDYQLCVHAIGDRANREVLDLFAGVLGDGAQSRPWRIEHAQHLEAQDVPRFAELGVIASMQGVHATSDGPWVPQRIGERRAREGAYVWRTLIDAGAVLSNGTDAPVEDVDPLRSYYASVTRLLGDGRAFFPEQSMTREEALRSYTVNAAYAAFEEESKGSLELGKLADVTVLSRDILTVPADQILDAEVLYTIVGGRVAYRSAGAASAAP